MSTRWTADQVSAYAKRQLAASANTRREIREKCHENRHSIELPATIAQPDHGSALDHPLPGETPRGPGSAQRFKITFVVRSMRPRDWDNNCTKFLQDRLIDAGILPSDGWDVLQGQVISLKAKTRAEEGTSVIIETA